jgi:hypothetical protein
VHRATKQKTSKKEAGWDTSQVQGTLYNNNILVHAYHWHPINTLGAPLWPCAGCSHHGGANVCNCTTNGRPTVNQRLAGPDTVSWQAMPDHGFLTMKPGFYHQFKRNSMTFDVQFASCSIEISAKP